MAGWCHPGPLLRRRGPVRLSDDQEVIDRVLRLVESVPTPVWGRDELGAGDMWNSNSVISWLLERAQIGTVAPPSGGRAPGWDAGALVARRGLVLEPELR